MRIHLATFTTVPSALLTLHTFEHLVASDSVGRHQLTSDPREADAIVFVDAHVTVTTDPLLTALGGLDLYRQHPERCFVYHKADTPVYILPGVYVGASPVWLRRLPVLGGPYCPLVTAVPPAEREPDLLYSFRGSRTSEVRERIFALSDPAAIIERSEESPWGGTTDQLDLAFAQVRQITLMHRSKFVLCPKGHGPSSHRIFETLASGRVPVVISDDWAPPPRVDWDSASLRIRERDAGRIPEILAGAEPGWPELAAGAAIAAREFSDARMWDHVMESIAAVAQLPRPSREPMFVRAHKARIRAGASRRRLRSTLKA